MHFTASGAVLEAINPASYLVSKHGRDKNDVGGTGANASMWLKRH